MADKRNDRQVGILMQLRSKEWVPAKVLAEQFEVSQRTIYRDIEDLLTRGVPIEGVPGPDGGYRLKSETPLDPLIFSSEDALSLYLLSSASTKAPGAIREQLAELETALRSGHGAEQQLLSLGATAQRVHFDTSDWYWRDEGSTHLPSLRGAILRGQAVTITHRATGSARATEALVKPYGLVWKSGDWYLVGAQVEGPPARYKLNSISRVAVTELTFPYPDDFILEAWWNQEMEAYGKGDIRVQLKASPECSPELLRLSLKENSEVEATSDGGMTIVLFVDEWKWLVPLIASYGGGVVVEHPQALHAAVRDYFQAGVAAYSDETNTPSDEPSIARFASDDSRLRSTRGRPES